ncbi:hypothetical protein KUTeg_024790 [Tegillarca granosa]|uniref:Uncharacterized protein n=1 Tax=Tegillarca granosa TaxID=220873 RepID=A0ABQ9E2B0_TEGGR|nr:hypothetical protein KUTeg_024790 [Tegillarca granosa]
MCEKSKMKNKSDTHGTEQIVTNQRFRYFLYKIPVFSWFMPFFGLYVFALFIMPATYIHKLHLNSHDYYFDTK